MYNNMRWGSVVVLLIVASALAGCIQPDAVTETPTPTFGGAVINQPPATQVSQPVNPPATSPAVVAPTPAPNTVPQGDTALISQLIAARGDAPTSLQVWFDGALGSDHLQGFSYTNQSGLACAGFLLLAFPNGVRQPDLDNGAKGCAPQPGIMAIAGVSFLVTTDGQRFTLVFGRVGDPNITAVAAEFADATSTRANPMNGGYLMIKPGVVPVTNVTAIDSFGNTVLLNILQVPVG